MNRPIKIISTLFAIFLLFLALLLASPTVLRSVPSRYLLYLPEPIQELGQRDNLGTLPTPSYSADVTLDRLLGEQKSPTLIPTIPPVVISTLIPNKHEVPIQATPIRATLAPTPTLHPPATPESTYPNEYLLNGIEHQFQGWNNCGPATIAMSLSYFNLNISQDNVAEWLKPNPEDRNVSPYEIVDYVESKTKFSATTFVNGDLDLLKRLISSGYPVMIETGIDPPGDYSWMDWYGHYYLVVGYNDSENTVQVYDSWLGSDSDENGQRINNIEGKSITYGEFDRHWRQFNRQLILVYEGKNQVEIEALLGPDYSDSKRMWESTLNKTISELEKEPEDAYLWFNVGTIYTNLDEFELAATAFDKSRQLGLPWRMLWYQFGPYEAYLETGRYQDVIDLADATLYQRPYFEESYYYRGLAYFKQNHRQQGIDDIQRAVTFNPRFHEAQTKLSELKNQE